MMIGNRALLDTCAAVALLNGDAAIAHLLKGIETPVLCVPVLGELHYGALNSKHSAENISRIDAFANTCEMAQVNEATSREYAALKIELRKKGRPIPENDIWIAALASQYGLALITKDAHFEAIVGLDIFSW